MRSWPTYIVIFTVLLSFIYKGQSSEDEIQGKFDIIKSGGTVLALDPNAIDKMVTGPMEVPAQSSISTMERSYAVIKFDDGSILELGENSNIFVEEVIRKEPRGFFGTTRVVLQKGSALSKIKKKFSGLPTYEIMTANEVSFAVKGTEFLTFVEKNSSDAWVLVKGGAVSAQDYNGDDSEVINPGQSILVKSGMQLTKPIKYEWPNYLNWDAKTNVVKLTKRIDKLVVFRESETLEKSSEIADRSVKPFVEDMNDEIDDVGYDEQQLGSLVRKEVRTSFPVYDAQIFNNGGLAIPDTYVSKKVVDPSETPVTVQKKSPKDDKKLMSSIINKEKANHLCKIARNKGFKCGVVPSCHSVPGSMKLASFPKVLSNGNFTVCVSCNSSDFQVGCSVKKNSCKFGQPGLVEIGSTFLSSTRLSLCLNLYSAIQ